METLDCIKTRRSIRKFKDTLVETEKIGNILDAGRCAPSAGNLQEWKFVLVNKEETRIKIAEACLEQYWISRAPIIIIVCCEPHKVERFYGEKGRTKYAMQSCASAVQNILLAAHDQGLAACWVGAFEIKMLKRILKMGTGVEIQAVIPVGYPDETPEKPKKYSVENVTYLETWGNRIEDLAAHVGQYSERIKRAAKKGKEMMHKVIKRK